MTPNAKIQLAYEWLTEWVVDIIDDALLDRSHDTSLYKPALTAVIKRLRDRLALDRAAVIKAQEALRVAEARLLALQNQRPAPAPVPLPDPVVGMQVRYDGREVEVMLAGPRFVAFTDRTCCLRHEWTPDRVVFITDSDAEDTADPDSEPLS